MKHTHPLRDGHPDDAALGDTPLVSLGQGDYRRDIMPGDVSKGHTRREESKALDALTRDAQRSGTVPLADAKPSVLPTLTPITTQVRKLELSPSLRLEHARSMAIADQTECELRDRALSLMLIATEMGEAEERGEPFTLHGEDLRLVRRCLGVFLCKTLNSMSEGGAS